MGSVRIRRRPRGPRHVGSLKCWGRSCSNRKYWRNAKRLWDHSIIVDVCLSCLVEFSDQPSAANSQRLSNHSRLIVSTAQVLFHRFFAIQSFHRHDRFIVAAAAVFLATKVEEAFYFRLQHVVKAYLNMRRIFKDSTSSSFALETVRNCT
jgi:hypothetical protein